MATNTLARAANDLGTGAWFGTALVDALSLDPAARVNPADPALVSARRRRLPLQFAGWAAAVGGATRLADQNRGRLGRQQGVASTAATKTALMTAATGATILGAAVETARGRPPRTLHALTALLTGGLLVADARLGEQQRPGAVVRGVGRKLASLGRSRGARRSTVMARAGARFGR